MLIPHDAGNLAQQAMTNLIKARKPGLPRLFTLEYDSSKLKTKNAFNREAFKKRHLLYGVVWPSTDYAPAGGVSLSNSTTYRDVTELQEHFGQAGTATLFWLDTEEVEEIG